jgi:hypothetical protein
MERRIARLTKRLPPPTTRRPDLSALSDAEVEELMWFRWLAMPEDTAEPDLTRLSPAPP